MQSCMNSLEQVSCTIDELFDFQEDDLDTFSSLLKTALMDSNHSVRIAARSYLGQISGDSFRISRFYEQEGYFCIDAEVPMWGNFSTRVCEIPETYTGLYERESFVTRIFESDSEGNELVKNLRFLS